MVFLNLLVGVVAIIACLITYFKWKFSYWRKKRVPYIKPHIPFGTSDNPFTRTRHSALAIQSRYDYFKSHGYKYGGLYASVKPALLLVDLEIIKNILSKDFQYFPDRGTYFNEKEDPLSANLFNLEGNKWRTLRASLTPTFTSGKMKTMFPTLIACGGPLFMALDELYHEQRPIEFKDVLGRFTTDVIGSCAFGIECNSFKEPESDFRKYGKEAFTISSKIEALKGFIAISSPNLGRRLGISLTDPAAERFFLNVVQETINYRKQNDVIRNDFIQLVMDLESENGSKQGLTIKEIAAQAFVFFLAGFETSSTTMTFCLYELAINQNIQDKVRNEIDRVIEKHGGAITYDAVMKMTYLNSVVDETLRKYPPGGVLPRVCVKDYQIPCTDVIIEKETRVFIPVYALHHDPEYFPEPERFDPERFNEVNKINILPYTYLPFGEGPRICIGLRFGLLQAKVGLIILLTSFKFTLNSKTKIPLDFDPQSFVLTPGDGVWLNIEKISKRT